jgi:hypothetical protein
MIAKEIAEMNIKQHNERAHSRSRRTRIARFPVPRKTGVDLQIQITTFSFSCSATSRGKSMDLLLVAAIPVHIPG